MSVIDKVRAAQIHAAEQAVIDDLERKLGIKKAGPTISMRAVKYEDDSYGVELTLTGLTTEQQAKAAMAHMQQMFCGEEINVQ